MAFDARFHFRLFIFASLFLYFLSIYYMLFYTDFALGRPHHSLLNALLFFLIYVFITSIRSALRRADCSPAFSWPVVILRSRVAASRRGRGPLADFRVKLFSIAADARRGAPPMPPLRALPDSRVIDTAAPARLSVNILQPQTRHSGLAASCFPSSQVSHHCWEIIS